MAKQTQIQIRVSEGDKEKIRQMAERVGLSVSEYILSRILKPEIPNENKENVF